MNIFVAPKTCPKLEVVKYPQAKNPAEAQHLLYDEENLTLYEVVKFSDRYRSWFVDNLLCQEGHMNLLTRVNPMFIFLPHLMEFASDQFRTLHDICQTFSSTPANENFSRLEYALSTNTNWSKICDTREVDDELFVRYSEKKTLDWLLAKHRLTVAALAMEEPTQTSRANIILEASDLIEQYLAPSLAKKFKELVRKDASASMEIGTGSSGSRSRVSHSSGAKRTAPASGAKGPLDQGEKAVSRQKAVKPEPKSGGIMNFFKPLNKLN